MQIKELNLKHFGKFSDKQIDLSEGINLFYGENESGKSTIFAFIKGMLFGMERGRGRASVNDAFSLYEPWENGNYYAGVLRFESDGKTFRLERNFDKYARSASLICEDDGEEFSLEHGDLDILLGGLTASGFENTAAIAQLKVETNQSLASELRNYAANYYAAGNSDIDLEGALQILRNEKKEIEKADKLLAAQKNNKRSRIQQEASYIWRDLYELKEEYRHITEEIEFWREQETKMPEPEFQDELEPRWRVNPLIAAAPIIAIIIAVMLIPRPWDYMLAIVFVLADILYIWNRVKDGKRKEITEPEADLAELKDEEQTVPLEKLQWEYNLLGESIKEKQTQYDNLQEQLEELDELGENFKEQDRRKQAIDIAVERLLKLSGEINQEVGKKLNARASEILAVITGGKYTQIVIDDSLAMNILSEGKRIKIERISRGTIEQIYLALRIAAGEILYEEEYPIILDDTFAYYDDCRMENTLKWLAEHKKQVFIFTCHKREIQTLKEAGIPFADIEIDG